MQERETYKSRRDHGDDHTLYTLRTEQRRWYSGAHVRPCSRNPIPHSSVPHQQVESTPSRKWIPEASMTLHINCHGGFWQAKRKTSTETQEITHAETTRLRDSIEKWIPLLGKRAGCAKSGASHCMGMGLAACGDLRKIGSFERFKAIMADVSGIRGKWSTVK